MLYCFTFFLVTFYSLLRFPVITSQIIYLLCSDFNRHNSISSLFIFHMLFPLILETMVCQFFKQYLHEENIDNLFSVFMFLEGGYIFFFNFGVVSNRRSSGFIHHNIDYVVFVFEDVQVNASLVSY